MKKDKKYLKLEGKSDKFIYGAIQTYEKVLANAQRMILAGEVKESEIAHLLREWMKERDTLLGLLGPSTYVSSMHAYADEASKERTRKSVISDVGLGPDMKPLTADNQRSINVGKND
ncbi:hypothetical protein [Domibacillus aminovorans]|uniref:Uncharacterized protein n=1 Tax=Domibacillus aminovorans TaxID=29332 RepID=A0A177L9E8_9BACI|nr:hypothetical protein [Domibacillus aminovorans]OAH62358.1 hypothetical protein AWH49_10370 [Domibacillus aminovorans]